MLCRCPLYAQRAAGVCRGRGAAARAAAHAKGQKSAFLLRAGPVADCCTVYLLLFRRCPADRGYGRHSEQYPELYGGYPGTLFVRQSRPHDAAQSYWLCAGVQRCAGGNSWQPRQRQPGGRCLYADRFGDFCTGRAVEQSRDPKGGFVHRLLPEPWGRRCGAAGHRPCSGRQPAPAKLWRCAGAAFPGIYLRCRLCDLGTADEKQPCFPHCRVRPDHSDHERSALRHPERRAPVRMAIPRRPCAGVRGDLFG